MKRTLPGFRVGAEWFCSEGCLQERVAELVESMLLGRSRGVSSERSLRPTLGLLLMEQGKLTKDELDEALRAQKMSPGSRIGELLKQVGVVSEREVTLALSRQFGVPWVNFVKGEVPESSVRLIPAVIARTYTVVPVDYQASDDRLLLAIVGPPDYAFLNGLSRMLELDVAILVGDQSKLEELVDRFYPARLMRDRIVVVESAALPSLAEIIGAKARQYRAEELRLERCGDRLWLRLIRGEQHSDFLIEVDLPNDLEAEQL